MGLHEPYLRQLISLLAMHEVVRVQQLKFTNFKILFTNFNDF